MALELWAMPTLPAFSENCRPERMLGGRLNTGGGVFLAKHAKTAKVCAGCLFFAFLAFFA